MGILRGIFAIWPLYCRRPSQQYRSRLKLSENFERHWSVRNSVGKFIWTNGLESSSKVSPYTGIGPWMALLSPNLTLRVWHVPCGM